TMVENETVLEEIRKLGFDGFLVEEMGEVNVATFHAGGMKSLTGNVGSWGVRAPTSQELEHIGLSVEQAVELQAQGDLRFKITTDGTLLPSSANFAFYRSWLADKWGKFEERILDEYRSLREI